MLPDDVYDELDGWLAPVDAELARRYPGQPGTRQPVHTVYVPADRFRAGMAEAYGRAALDAVAEHGPLPFDDATTARVLAKLATEPVEDLRIDFEDGYGVRDGAEEDAAARAAGAIVRDDYARRPPEAGPPDAGPPDAGPPDTRRPLFVGLRCKSLEAATRWRAVRTVDLFLAALGDLPEGFVVTLPKVSAVEQVQAMVGLCARLEEAHGLAGGALRFEIQVETPAAVLGPDGVVTLARMVHAAQGRCAGLHHGTYDYSAALGVAAPLQSMEHPVADLAKGLMQVAAAGTGVRVSDGSTNVVPVGDTAAVRAAWDLHARLVRRSLQWGIYQGWDLHPAQLPTRFGATYGFFRESAAPVARRLESYLERRSTGVVDEPATARALAGFLLRGLDCGALDDADVPFDRATLETQ